MQREETEADAGLAISSEKAFYIIAKAREFDEKVAPSDPDSGSNPSDDRDVDILEDYRNDPTLEELEGALRGLNDDEQLDMIALMWLGRGDFSSFDEARAEASAMSDKHIPRYLIGTPMLADYLEEGLTQVGVSLEEFEINRM
jgi:hypothetical protein